MRRLIRNLVLIYLILFPVSVLAADNISISPSSLTIKVGEKKTFSITAYNAIGDVSMISSNSNVAILNMDEWETGMVDEGQTKKGTITVTGISVGTAIITLEIDAATFDGEDLAGQKKYITVNVVSKSSSSSNSNNNTNNNTNSNTSNPTQEKVENPKTGGIILPIITILLIIISIFIIYNYIKKKNYIIKI